MPWIHCWLGYFKILIVDTSLTQLLPHSATSSLAYVSNLARVRQLSALSCMLCSLTGPVSAACCSPIASASAAAPRLHPLQSATAPCLRPVQLLLPEHVRFSYCSPIASVSAAAPQLRPFQLLIPDCVHKVPSQSRLKYEGPAYTIPIV